MEEWGRKARTNRGGKNPVSVITILLIQKSFPNSKILLPLLFPQKALASPLGYSTVVHIHKYIHTYCGTYKFSMSVLSSGGWFTRTCTDPSLKGRAGSRPNNTIENKNNIFLFVGGHSRSLDRSQPLLSAPKENQGGGKWGVIRRLQSCLAADPHIGLIPRLQDSTSLSSDRSNQTLVPGGGGGVSFQRNLSPPLPPLCDTYCRVL